MQTLTFNTKTKEVQLLDGPKGKSGILEEFNNISTVRIDNGFYELIQIMSTEPVTKVPVMRVPISNTNMIILN